MLARRIAPLSLCLWTACGPTPPDASPPSSTSTATTSPATTYPATSSTSTTAAEPTTSPPATTTTTTTTTTGETGATSEATGPVDPVTTTHASTTTTGEGTADDTSAGDSSTGELCPAIPCDFVEMVVTPAEPDGCLLLLDPWPAAPDLTEVVLDRFSVPRVEDCATQDGWVFRDVTCPNDAIELCGQRCFDLQLAGEALVKYFCLGG